LCESEVEVVFVGNERKDLLEPALLFINLSERMNPTALTIPLDE